MFLFGAISGAFLCVPACFFWCGFPVLFVVLFLVSFGDFAGGIFCAFPGAFSTVFWCFFPCIFSCLSLFFSVYVSPWWWSCFLPCFFWWFLGAFSVLFSVLFFVFFFLCFFCAFYRAFFRAFFRSFSCLFSCFFFRALGGTQDKQPQYFAFWPVLFLVLFLVVTTSEDRIYTMYNPSSIPVIDSVKIQLGISPNQKQCSKAAPGTCYLMILAETVIIWQSTLCMHTKSLLSRQSMARAIYSDSCFSSFVFCTFGSSLLAPTSPSATTKNSVFFSSATIVPCFLGHGFEMCNARFDFARGTCL